MSGSGTWIDWQYLFDSAKLLAKCRLVIRQYEYEILRIEYPWIVIIDVQMCTPNQNLFLCRYTLQYTYPYAYYMEQSPRKHLVRLKDF